jgi:uncharacterized FlaG/YvyC family protein
VYYTVAPLFCRSAKIEDKTMEVLQTNAQSSVAIRPAAEKLNIETGRKRTLDHSVEKTYTDVPDTPENRSKIDRAIDALDTLSSEGGRPNTRFTYNIHNETGTIQVKLYNYLTGEVIQEVPSSKLLEFAAHLEELSGLLVDEQA